MRDKSNCVRSMLQESLGVGGRGTTYKTVKFSLQTLAVFLIRVASLLSTATVGGTPRLNSSLHSSKISSHTNSLSLMLNNPIGTKTKTEIHLISFANDCLKVNMISYSV